MKEGAMNEDDFIEEAKVMQWVYYNVVLRPDPLYTPTNLIGNSNTTI